MGRSRKQAKAISLVDELLGLEAVLEAAELIAELLGNHDLPNGESSARAPHLVAAVIDLALSRVRLLRRVVLQQADPLLLAGRYNTRRGPIGAGEEPDIYFKGELAQKPKRRSKKEG